MPAEQSRPEKPQAQSRRSPSCRRRAERRGARGRSGAALCAPRCESENGPGESSKAEARAVSDGTRQSRVSASYLHQVQVGEYLVGLGTHKGRL
jgi:hypothetical protein